MAVTLNGTNGGLLPGLVANQSASPVQTSPSGVTLNSKSGGLLPGLAMGVKAAGPAVSSPSTTLTPSQTSSVGKNITLTPTADIQKKLGVSSDGIYGNQTTKAVRDFQTKNNLKVDGIVGPETHQALMGNPPPAPTPPTPPVSNSTPPTSTVSPVSSSTVAPNSTPPPGTSQTDLISNLANKSNTASPAYTDATTHYNEIAKKLADYDAETARLNQNIEGQPGVDMHSVIGQGANLARTRAAERASIAGELQSASNVLSAANSQQGLQLQAGQSAASFNQPVQQFGMLTNPATGQIIGGNGATGGSVMQSALQNAYNMYQQGASWDDIVKTTHIDTFGVLGTNALVNAINQGSQGGQGSSSGGSFNPTSYNTQVQTNQGNLANVQTQAFNLDTGLKQIEAIKPVASNLLRDVSSINPTDSPIWNEPIMNYVQKLGNSGAAYQWTSIVNDILKFQSQILAANNASTTPSAQTEQVASMNPYLLPLNQMQSYLDTLSALGNNQLSVFQTQKGNVGGTQAGYSGAPIAPVTRVTPATPNRANQGLTGAAIDAAVKGGGLEIGSNVINAAKSGQGILGYILGSKLGFKK